jgi:hypothetical protein
VLASIRVEQWVHDQTSALVVLWGLVAFGHVAMRKIDGWQDLPKINSSLKDAA